MSLPFSVKALALGFAASGTVHLVKPEFYLPLMPSWVPAHREVILASGVAEIACAAGLAVPATRRAAGWASVWTAKVIGTAASTCSGPAIATTSTSST